MTTPAIIEAGGRRGRLRGVILGLLVLGAAGCESLRVPDPNVIYVAFGDSATAGPADRDYPEFLPGALQEDDARFANEGNGGESTAEGLERLEDLLAAELFPNAEVLLYWEGGNDLIDFIAGLDPLLLISPSSNDFPYEDELDRKLDAIQANVAAAIQDGRDAGLDVYVATYYPLRSGEDCPAAFLNVLLPSQAQNANQYVDRLNARIRQAASANGATLVDIADLGEDLVADSANYENCNHLSSAGNAAVAEAFAEALR